MKFFLIVSIFLFSACSIKNYEHTKTKIVIIKTPKLKFADMGYIRNSGDAIELELYMAGRVVQRFSINHLICVDDGCMSKSAFNKEYMNCSYPDVLLQNILLGNNIYNGINLQETDDGFVQNIKNEDVDIRYIVNSNVIYFKDKKNHIIFKIKDIK